MSERLIMVIVWAVLLTIVIGVPYLLLFGGAKRFLRTTLQRRYDKIEIHDTRQPGDVAFVYHTYRGFLIWFVQDEHRIFARPDDAVRLLGRLLRFNLTFGMMSYGLAFVPFVAIGNYIAQKRSIQGQSEQIESELESATKLGK